MQNMTYAMKERIGNPSLFCGRKKEMELLLKWVSRIPKELAESRALLSRRKSGKTAIMLRLFNILWNQNDKVVPFYIEVLDEDQWLLDFALRYYLTFFTQYLSFLTRTILPENPGFWKIEKLERMAAEIGHENMLEEIHYIKKYIKAENAESLKQYAFGAPARFAGFDKRSFLVMIDEIQFMTKHIFLDKDRQICHKTLPGAYHGLVESKTAPMLVSGSYVGWMSRMMFDFFKGGRLKRTKISPRLSFGEGMEAVRRYAGHHAIPVSEESALAMNILTQSDPYYIATLFRSDFAEEDFTDTESIVRTLAYEISRDGKLYHTWAEYIDSTIEEVNDTYAKQILLFLSRERHKECTRKEISDHLNGELSDRELEMRLRTLAYGDLITKGTSDFRHSGIPDDILDLIFRERYQEEIHQVRPDTDSELTARIKELEDDKSSLQGALNELRGRMLEFIVHRELNRCRKKGRPVRNFRQRLRPVAVQEYAEKMEDMLTACCESRFDTVWMNYYIQLPGAAMGELDVLAEGADTRGTHALVFGIKNRDEKYPPSMREAKSFVTKAEMLRQRIRQEGKKIRFVCPVYLSAKGFKEDVEEWLHEHGVLTADMETWDT